jgi:hypothetical protein
MFIFFGCKFHDIFHILIVELDGVRPLVQTKHHLQIRGVIDPFYAVVVQQIVLLLPLDQPHLELSVLLLLFHRHQLPQNVLEELVVSYRLLTLLCDLEEHVLETHHVQRTLLEGELHHFKHYYDEVRNVSLMVRQLQEVLLDLFQLFVEDQPADLHRRVL